MYKMYFVSFVSFLVTGPNSNIEPMNKVQLLQYTPMPPDATTVITGAMCYQIHVREHIM
jgi:hypothetical protein